MRARSFLCSAMVGCTLVGVPRVATAQWQVGLDLAWTSFGDAASDTSAGSSGAVFHPGAGGTVGVRIEHQWSRFGLAISAHRMKPTVAEESDVVIVAAKHQLRFTEIAPAVTVRIARLAAGASLHVQAGPVVDIWEPQGLSARSEVGVATGLTVLFPLTGRLSGAVRAMLAHSGSPFEGDDLPDRFEPHAMWRHAVSIGLQMGF